MGHIVENMAGRLARSGALLALALVSVSCVPMAAEAPLAAIAPVAAPQPGTARADFFILASDMPALDATANDPGFAAFGHVTEGMDVVRKILASPVSPTKGEGAMKGQMLDPPVKILKMERVSASKP